MQERNWLIPSVVLTVLGGLLALILMPNVSGLLPALMIIPAWMAAAALIGSVYGFASMMLHGVERPGSFIAGYFNRNTRKLAFVTLIVLLAGFNMIAFMWIKPLLNYLIPFWADPFLADWDRMLFLGHDPWRMLQWLDFPAAVVIYHPGWFATMIGALLIVAYAPPSSAKSAVLLSYFVLWSLAGPLIHILMPAAGPIFYDQMGYGSRFAGLHRGGDTATVANYLWSIYATERFGAGSGISAMPSMHVTISSWVVIVFYVFARRWLAFAVAAWLLIFLLSISLGWHYALDGVVGMLAAIVCHIALSFAFQSHAQGCASSSEESRPEDITQESAGLESDLASPCCLDFG